MKAIFVLALVIASATVAAAQTGGYGTRGLSGTGSNPSSHYVSPYTTSTGTYVGGHHQTNPNTTQTDNFGTRGNVNPYTGSVGSRGARY